MQASDDPFYTFDDTDALLDSLQSNSSLPNLSPSDLNGYASASTKGSSASVSPDEKFLSDEWTQGLTSLEDEEDFKENIYAEDPFGIKSNGFVSPQNVYRGDNNANLFISPQSTSSVEYQNDILNFKKQKLPQNEASSEREGKDSQLVDETPKTKESVPASATASTTTASSMSGSKVTKPRKDRSVHNVIEKKYRNNINTKILALRNAVPSLRIASGDAETTMDDLDGLSPASKINKASVLSKATEYIKHLEKKTDLLYQENEQLKQYISSISQQQQQQQQQHIFATPYGMTTPAPPIFQSNQFAHPRFPNTSSTGPMSVHNASPPHPQNYQMGVPGKVLMGGMATMVGQNLFGGNNEQDFRGLSSLPIFCGAYIKPFVHIVEFSFLLLSVLYIFLPTLFTSQNTGDDKENTKISKISVHDWYLVIKELVFVQVGTRAREAVSAEEVSGLVNNSLLLCRGNNSLLSLLFLYLKLQTFKSSFEVSFGKLVLAKLLISYSDFSSYLNLSAVVQKSVEEIANQKVTDQSLRYFFKDIKSFSFQNSECFRRLLNIFIGLPVNFGCTKGAADLGYNLILKDERVSHDYKSLVVSIRANEIFREVLLEYIVLTFSESKISKLDNEELRELKTELWNKLTFAEYLAPNRSIIDIRIKIFKSVLNEKYLNAALEVISEESASITKSHSLNNEKTTQWSSQKSGLQTEENKSGQEDIDIQGEKTKSDKEAVLEDSDSEEIYDSENFDSEGFSSEADEEELELYSDNFGEKETGLNSRLQNLLSQDLFNALSCSCILKYIHHNQRDEAFKLLKYVDLQKVELTLLSLISLCKLMQKFPKGWTQDYEHKLKLEKLVAYLRVWVGDLNNGQFNDLEGKGIDLRREISDNLVKIEKSLSDVGESFD